MSDLELMFLVLAVVYGWECACWLPKGSFAFLTWASQTWRVALPASSLSNSRGGLVFAAPLPPLGTLLTCAPFPFLVSPEAILTRARATPRKNSEERQPSSLFRFKEVRTIESRDRRVLIDGHLVMKAASFHQAGEIVARLRSLWETAADQRTKLIQGQIRAALDAKAVQETWQKFVELAAPLKWLCNFLFVYLFIIAPMMIWEFGLARTWLGILVGLLLVSSTTAFRFQRAHKILYPKAEDERFTHFLTILLSPATTVRARDALSRPLLQNFEPLAVAKALCPAPAFEQFAGAALRDLRYPVSQQNSSKDHDALAVEQFNRELLLQSTEEFLKRNGVKPDDLLRAPAPVDDASRVYCPRCLAQFTSMQESCPDCGGAPLLEFPNTKPKPEIKAKIQKSNRRRNS